MSASERNFSRVSLLQGAATQGELIPAEELPDSFYQSEEAGENAAKPRYTAERFFRKRPEDYTRCVELLAAQWGRLKIARTLRIHHETVAAVAEREGVAIDIVKQEIKRHLRRACLIGAERMPDVIASLPGGQLPVALAITLDKLAALDGEPTQRVEVTVKGHLTHEAVLASLDSFPEAIDVEASPMVLGGEAGGQKGGAAGGSGAGSEVSDLGDGARD